jgi:hypothetical protein
MDNEICLFGLSNGVIKEHLSGNTTQKNWMSSIAANSSAFENTDLTITGRCCQGFSEHLPWASLGGLIEKKHHWVGVECWTPTKSTYRGNCLGRSDVEDFLYVLSC